MRIVAVRGCNLASLAGDFAVQLDRPPLDCAGLFAITGPTGSGKSTILDALCLALFDVTPRLPGRKGVEVGRAGDPAALRLGSADVRSILTRGTAEGFAEVDFVGSDGGTYRARWEVWRARRRANGRLQDQVMTLVDLGSGQQMGHTKTEVLAAISDRLGLSFEQFRRSALLAQGDFAAFLDAPAKGRSELLERITGTEIYSRLSVAAFDHEKAARVELDRINSLIGEHRVLDAEERLTLEAARDEQRRSLERLAAEQTQVTAVVGWHQQCLRREQAVRTVAAEVDAAEQQVQAAEPRRAEVAAVQQVQPMRPLVSARDRAEAEHEAAQKALEAARAEADTARQQVARHRTELAAAEQNLAAAERARHALKPQLDQARQLDARLEDARNRLAEGEQALCEADEQARLAAAELDEITAQQHETLSTLKLARHWLADHHHLASLGDQWQRWQAELDEVAEATAAAAAAEQDLAALDSTRHLLTGEISEVGKQVEALAATTGQGEAELEQLEAALARLPEAELRQERQRLEEERARLEELERLLTEMLRLHRERLTAEEETGRKRQLAEQAAARAGELAEALDSTRLRLDEAERARDLALTACTADVQTLRGRLADGEPCPVCGATSHPWAGEQQALDTLLADQEKRVGQLAAETEQLATELERQRAAEDHARTRIVELEQHDAAHAAALDELSAQWRPPAKRQQLSAEPDPDLHGPILRQRYTEAGQELAVVKEQQQEAEQLRAKVDQQRKALDGSRRQRRDLERRLGELSDRAHALERNEAALRAAHKAAEATAGRAMANLEEPLAGMTDWQQRLRGDASAFRSWCAQQAEDWSQQSAAAQEAERAAARLEPLAAAARERDEAARNRLAAARDRHTREQADQEELLSVRAELLGGRQVAEVDAELEQAEHQAEAGVTGCRASLEAAGQRLAAGERTVQLREEALDEAHGQLGVATTRLDDELTTRGLDLAEVRVRLDRDAAWLEEETDRLAELDTQLVQARAAHKEHRRLLAEHLATDAPQLSQEQAEERLQVLLTELEAARAAAADLEVQLRQDDERRTRQATLQTELDKQQRQWQLWAAMRELIGSKDGGKLRTFAQSLTLEALLGHANHHLADLAPRYRIERVPDTDLDLQVIDRDMAEEVRSTNTLSGGETFLVSLALALGLASLSSHRTQVDSLFIDEGFGSLDPQTLDVALAGLDALQASGRQIGVISHVPAMVERIGIQVAVEPLGGGRSRVRVVDAFGQG